MNHRRPLIAVLSSLISQILLFLVLVVPPNPFSLTTPIPHSSAAALSPLLLYHFLSTAAALPFLPHKRKRAPPDNDSTAAAKRTRLDSVVPTTPDSFQHFFRMKSSSFEWLCSLLEPLLECRDPVGSPLRLAAEIRLGIGLFRLATGADYPEIADRFRVSERDSKFCVKHLCRVLCTNYRFWVGFPSQTELDSVSTRIETLAGIPNCCGIIGCTRFNFEIGDKENLNATPHNQSRTVAVAAQIVVDSSSKIVNIAAGFHGRKRDSQILELSSLYRDVSKSVLLNSPNLIQVSSVAIPQYLLGNGSYPLLPWLIVPFVDPERGSMEENFNNVHRLLRAPWTKAVASLRSWGILTGRGKVDYKSAVACIGACSILHNMMIMREDYSAFSDHFDGDDDGGGFSEDQSLGGDSDQGTVAAVEVRKMLTIAAKRR